MKRFGTIIAAAICAANLAGPPAIAEDQDWIAGTDQMRAGPSNMCVSNVGGRVVLKACKTDDKSQRWIFLMNGEIRPANSIMNCLDVPRANYANNQALLTYPCNGGKNQRWGVSGKGQIYTHKAMCMDVPRGEYRGGRQLILWKCGANKANQRFGKHTAGRITNAQLAAVGFPTYRKCKEKSDLTEQQGKCYLKFKPTDPLPKNITDPLGWLNSLRWGFHTGGGAAWKTGKSAHWTLDVGQRYSLDRCAYAHDTARWTDKFCPLQVDFYTCLLAVRPINKAEEAALNQARNLMRQVLQICAITRLKPDGELPPNNKVGEKDDGW